MIRQRTKSGPRRTARNLVRFRGRAGALRRDRPAPGTARIRQVQVVIDPASLAAPASTRALLTHWGDRAEALEAELAHLISMLLEANRQFNLTADVSPADQWTRHVEDALACARIIEDAVGPPGEAARILDVGSGGGMPGLVWALLWPEAAVHLIEATQKKAAFLQRASEQLRLARVEVIGERAETVGRDDARRESYDWVGARALAPLAALAEWTVPFARVGGAIFAVKGARIEEEIQSAKRAFRVLGAPGPPAVFPYALPCGKSRRLLAYRKIERTASIYPRRPGLALKSPL